jgi:hypothetical protein
MLVFESLMRLHPAVLRAVMIGFVLTPLACSDPRFKPTYPVQGKILFEGKPAGGAAISLHPLNVPDHPWTKPSAEADEYGQFTVSTYKEHDGAPAGEYAVTIVWLPKGYTGPLEKGNKLPGKYASKETSGLTATIVAGDNNLPPFLLTK